MRQGHSYPDLDTLSLKSELINQGTERCFEGFSGEGFYKDVLPIDVARQRLLRTIRAPGPP